MTYYKTGQKKTGPKNILSGGGAPTAALGKNGDIYLKYTTVSSDLEYISNASTNSFVPIGTKGSKNVKFVIECNIHGGGDYATPIGARTSVTSSNMLIFFKYNGGNTARYAVNSNDTAIGSISNFYDKPITITLSNDIVRIEDKNGNYVEATPSNTGNFSTSQMMLFNLGTGASAIYGADTACYMDLYECKVYENNELRKYLLPKTDNNVIGLVDAVNGDFYASSGSITGTARTEVLIEKFINSAYVKIDGIWQPLTGSSPSDINMAGGDITEERKYVGSLIERLSADSDKVTVSSTWAYSDAKWKAFNGVDPTNLRSPDNAWTSNSSDNSCYIQYKFDSLKYLTKLSLSVFSNFSEDWTGDIKVLGSEDGNDWYSLLTNNQESIRITAKLQELTDIDINLNPYLYTRYIRIKGVDNFAVYNGASMFFNEIYAYGGIVENISALSLPFAYKNYAQFTNGGFFLPFTVNSDYKVTVEFTDTEYVNNNIILDNSVSANYLRFVVYGNQYYSSSGTSQSSWGSWSAGSHTFVCNDGNGKNTFDGDIVQDYTPTTYNANMSIGIAFDSTTIIASTTYISRFKIESISTGDVICDLKPALISNTSPCMYDIVNNAIYVPNGIQVVDTIS